jgi:hypothetical protein
LIPQSPDFLQFYALCFAGASKVFSFNFKEIKPQYYAAVVLIGFVNGNC